MSIVVVGDLLLDHDMAGEATRLSPDAPVPVVDIERSNYRAGGAGLVASMLAATGQQVVLVGVISDDAASHQLRKALEGIALACGPSGAPTPVKTRVRASDQAVVRFDQGCSTPPVPEVTPGMLQAIAAADAVIVADYGRRLVENPQLRQALQDKARQSPVVWDPHPTGAVPVSGVWAVTPNHIEALKFAGQDAPTGDRDLDAAAAAALLAQRWGCNVLVTQGCQGALLHRTESEPQRIPAPKVETSDPCGAGDRFVGALAVALAGGADLPQAAHQAVEAAAAFLAKGGVAALERPPGNAEAAPPWQEVEGADAWRVIEQVRAAGGTVVATGGCFDLLHAGHTRTLQAARDLGDCLVVLLNTDDSVRRLKGNSRPIIAADDRAEMLQALGCVDGVLLFEADTPLELLEQVRPDIWVKGGDYDVQKLPETELIASWGGRSVTVPYRVARSTTSLAEALAKVG